MNLRKSYLTLGAYMLLTLPITSQVHALVHGENVFIDGSLCVGFDCVNGESFGFDTIRLKENNLRIKFQDTSTTASFPTTDWQLTANDSTNGGANKFSIDDITGGRTPFTIEANAPSHSLYVDDGGRIGFGTSTPVVENHIKDGDTPTVRLEQDGSSGFTPQTWDLAGNETNFFIRDATNGSTLPFRIRPSAPTSAIDVHSNGNVGLGTSTTPAGSMHIRRTGTAEPSIVLENTGAGVSWEMKVNASTGRMTFKNLLGTTGPGGGPTTPFKFAPDAVENLFRVGIAANDTVDIKGNLEVDGDLTVTGDCTEADGPCADYVFEDDYPLRSLHDVAVFIKEKKHLPNVPSAREMEENGISIAHITGRLLEKIEELTLYTLQQEDMIAGLHQRLDAIETR